MKIPKNIFPITNVIFFHTFFLKKTKNKTTKYTPTNVK